MRQKMGLAREARRANDGGYWLRRSGGTHRSGMRGGDEQANCEKPAEAQAQEPSGLWCAPAGIAVCRLDLRARALERAWERGRQGSREFVAWCWESRRSEK
jgi:hypothetical protein